MFEELQTTFRMLIVAVAGVAAILVARPQLLDGESQLRPGLAPGSRRTSPRAPCP